ncbi:hypothetical protein SCHPADRAFT_701574 [Schizopora paradoxa]|uniref:Uncharacterized protein n=1 Tax=Schizopora paradoxa TaxID=27342 RepID=A0A0H2R2U6_9AGAM|nr:hypothetical protein SCHPADRAFT_701574 [Schizopora paradoxa]
MMRRQLHLHNRASIQDRHRRWLRLIRRRRPLPSPRRKIAAIVAIIEAAFFVGESSRTMTMREYIAFDRAGSSLQTHEEHACACPATSTSRKAVRGFRRRSPRVS